MGDKDRNDISYGYNNGCGNHPNHNVSYSRAFNDGKTVATVSYNKTEGYKPSYETRVDHHFNEDTRAYLRASGQCGRGPDRFNFGFEKRF